MINSRASEPAGPARFAPPAETEPNLIVLPMPASEEGMTASEVANLFGYEERPAASPPPASAPPVREPALVPSPLHRRLRVPAPRAVAPQRFNRHSHAHRAGRPAAAPLLAPAPATHVRRAGVAQRVLNRITSVLLVCSLMVGWSILALTIAQHVWGYNSYVVLSGSMRPTIPVGTLVLDQPVPATQVAVGDIVSFHPVSNPNLIVTHRVVEIAQNPPGARPGPYARTKGDANPTPDSGLLPLAGEVNRVVIWVPEAGYAVAFLEQPGIRVLLVIVPLALMATLLLSAVWRTPR